MERFVGDKFITWLNNQRHASYSFSKRGTPAPDLIYRDGATELGIEISSAYYDAAYARFQWQYARGNPTAPTEWSGTNFEARLIRNIGEVVDEKSKRTYGQNCCLVIYVRPDLTPHDELVNLLRLLVLPAVIPLKGVYILGYFAEGYRVIPIKEA